MKQIWRRWQKRREELKQYIEDHYITGPGDWSEIYVSTSGKLSIYMVSQQFVGIAHGQRNEKLQEALQHLEMPIDYGMSSFFTPQEAKSLEIPRPLSSSNRAYTWIDLAIEVANREKVVQPHVHKAHIPATIVFYSFKGGVGCTTALIQTATILARRGQKVAIIDLDLGSSGLSSALGFNRQEYGIVDFFYERSHLPKEAEPAVGVAEIFTELRVADAPGQIFVAPAGKIDLDYMAEMGDLGATDLTARGENLWSILYSEITEQLQPDIILVDSSSGLNQWSSFSLLRVADRAIVFLYPNEQNRPGVSLITSALSGMISTAFVFSPVPTAGERGMQLVKKQWDKLQLALSDSETEVQNGHTNPIVIPYLADIALADTYPIEEFVPYYVQIADAIVPSLSKDSANILKTSKSLS